MKILSLEDYSASYPEDDQIASSQSSHEPALEPYTPESEEAHLVKEQNHIEQALQTVTTLDGITAVMEEMGDGMSPAAGRALMIAVEHLCSTYSLQHGKIRLPAFEEFSTKRHRKETALESMAVINEYVGKIWEIIVNAFNAIITFFKKIFNKQTKVNKELIKEAEDIQKEVREGKKEPAATASTPATVVAPAEPKELTVSSRSVYSTLQINGKVPEGKALVQEMHNHFKLMKQFDYAFSLTEGTILKLLNSAIKSIHKDGPGFQEAINACQSEFCTNNIGRIAADQHAAGDLDHGYALYEAPLIFGGKSVYRTGIIGTASLTGDSIRFFIADSHGAKREFEIEPMPVLTFDIINELTASTKERVVSLVRIMNQRDQNCDALDKIKHDIIKIRDNKNNAERSARRAKVLFHVINVYFEYREVISSRLLHQDQKVCKALLAYVSLSLNKA